MLPGGDDPAAVSAEAIPQDLGRDVDSASPARPVRLAWWVSVLVVVVDQISKFAVTAVLPLYGAREIIPGLLDVVHVRNTGVAFGFLNDLAHPSQSLITTLLAFVALLGIAYYARHIRPEEKWVRLGLALILGGAVGNLIDRLRLGFVVDFVDVYWQGWHFWAFNAADAAITFGAIFVFLDLLFSSRHVSHSV